MAVTANFVQRVYATETLGVSLDLQVAAPTVIHSLSPISADLSATSTPVVSQIWSDSITLTAGAATIDLSSLARSGLATLDLSALKVQAFIVRARSTNTDTVTVADGGTNGYNIFGDASGQVTLAAGAAVSFYSPEGLQDIGSSDKTIDLSSSDADAIVDVVILAG